MLRKGMWAAGIAALTAAAFAFSTPSVLAAPRGGGHVGGVHVAPAHLSGYGGNRGVSSGYRGVSSGNRGVSSGYRGVSSGYRGSYGHDYDRGRYGYSYGRGYYGGLGYGLGLYAGYPYSYGASYGYPTYGSAYYSDNYYPSTTTIYSTPPSTSYYYNPPADITPSNYVPSASDMTATIGIHVPVNAQVWFDDTLTQQVGEWREFSSPPLEAGKTFHYVIRAKWNDNGKVVEQSRRIDVRARQLNNIDFTRPESTGTPPKP